MGEEKMVSQRKPFHKGSHSFLCDTIFSSPIELEEEEEEEEERKTFWPYGNCLVRYIRDAY